MEKHCNHAYVQRCKSYCDKNLECRVMKIRDTCIFCGKELEERVSYMNDLPKRKLFYFGSHLK